MFAECLFVVQQCIALYPNSPEFWIKLACMHEQLYAVEMGEVTLSELESATLRRLQDFEISSLSELRWDLSVFLQHVFSRCTLTVEQTVYGNTLSLSSKQSVQNLVLHPTLCTLHIQILSPFQILSWWFKITLNYMIGDNYVIMKQQAVIIAF